jgi:hypothetical protein
MSEKVAAERGMAAQANLEFLAEFLKSGCQKPCDDDLPQLFVRLLRHFFVDLVRRTHVPRGSSMTPRDVDLALKSIPEYSFCRQAIKEYRTH